MARPGVEVSLLDVSGSTLSFPTDTGVLFAAGLTQRGPITAEIVLSINDYIQKYGDRQTYSVLYDYLETFFREGGYQAYIGRVVGPSATSGTLNLLDTNSAVSLIVTAIGPGDWSGDYKIEVVAGSVANTFVIQVENNAEDILETSGDLVDQNAAIVWSQSSDYIRVTLGATALNPVVMAATVMSDGDDDRSNITDAEWAIALTAFTADLGPGQVAETGRTSSTAHTQLIDHAEANNRVALLDLEDSGVVATLADAVDASRFAACFAPWITIPGLIASSTRSVPPSCLVAGIIARNDPVLGPNHPAAGNSGLARYAIGLSQPAWTDADRETLNAASVNVVRSIYGSIVVYGWRSSTNAVTDSNWMDFGNARLYMALSAELNQIGQNYMFEDIDGQNGRTINGFHDALATSLLKHWNSGELFGDAPEQAFDVDTSPSVNTLATIAALELHAVCYVKMSPFAELVAIQVVKQPLA